MRARGIENQDMGDMGRATRDMGHETQKGEGSADGGGVFVVSTRRWSGHLVGETMPERSYTLLGKSGSLDAS